MLRTSILLIALVTLATFVTAEPPKMINYSGRLTNDDGPVTATVPMTFTIYDAYSGGNSKWTETHPAVSVVDGYFTVNLGGGWPAVPIEDSVFSDDYRWLEVIVDGEVITPRTRLLSIPYAFQSNWTHIDKVIYTNGEWGIAKSGNNLYGDNTYSHVNLGRFSTTGTNGENFNYCTVGGGGGNIASGDYSTVCGGFTNIASGYRSTVAGGQFNDATGHDATIAGGSANTAGSQGVTVAGGLSNTADGNRSTISGGEDNTASGDYSSIGGGQNNVVTSTFSTIGGGTDNTASGMYSCVSGGGGNVAGWVYSTVGGGCNNAATSVYSTIPGGYNCEASGNSSFASGYRAKANHIGTFVWADYTDADFASAGENQFLIRATGGVGINTNNPNYALDVNGDINVAGSYNVKKGGVDYTHPDYVFEPDYKLMTVDELKEFVMKHKHLPNVISADDVKKNEGFKLDELLIQMLEKIEEQTLYIIQLDEKANEVDNLKAENDELKSQVAKLNSLMETVLANMKTTGNENLASNK